MLLPLVDPHTFDLSADHIPAGPSDHILAVSVSHILAESSHHIQAMTVDHIPVGFLDHIPALSSDLLLCWKLRHNHSHYWPTEADRLLGHSTCMNHYLGFPYPKTHREAVLGIRIQAACMRTVVDGFLPKQGSLRPLREYNQRHYMPLPCL